MMDGQARVSGQIYKDVEIGGKTYRLSQPNMVGIYGEVEAWIVARKTDPLVLAVRACQGQKNVPPAPPEMHAVIWEAAMKTASAARIASKEELDLFWGSRWANAFLFLKSLDPKHSEEVPTVEAAMEIVGNGVDMDMLLFTCVLYGLDMPEIVQKLVDANVNLDELMAQISVVNGEADIKNLSGRSETPAQASQQTEAQDSEDGLESTATSLNDMD